MDNAVDSLRDFRSPGGANRRLAHWDVREPTLRWFKSYLHLAAATTPEAERELLRSLDDHGLGAPISVTAATVVGTREVFTTDLDYLYAAEELSFISRSLSRFEPIRTVCELGAGFGRTAHLFLAARPSLSRYTIVDLADP
jgi:hypothetical protein